VCILNTAILTTNQLPEVAQSKKTKHLLSLSQAQFQERLDSLDLEPIVAKLMDKKEGEGWTLEYADKRVGEYKMFLMLNFLYPTHDFVPTHDIDCVWHRHVMDTEKYNKDCELLFSFAYQRWIVSLLRPVLSLIGIRINAGLFFDHFPYFGMRGEEDKRNLGLGYLKTQEYFMSHFGVSILPNNGNGCIKSCHWCQSISWIERPKPERS
jgi:Glycine-rich domain-containing protein-like